MNILKNDIESLFRDVLALGEKFYKIDNEYPQMLTISILPMACGTSFQASLVFSEDIKTNEAKYLDLPSWLNKNDWDYHSELYGNGNTLISALIDLKNQLNELMKLSELKTKNNNCSWILKDLKGRYYNCEFGWAAAQKDATKYISLIEAKSVANILRDPLKIVKIKKAD